MKELNTLINDIIIKSRIRRRFMPLFICFIFTVAFFVPIMLINPAESRSAKRICEMQEHKHTENCYELICDKDESDVTPNDVRIDEISDDEESVSFADEQIGETTDDEDDVLFYDEQIDETTEDEMTDSLEDKQTEEADIVETSSAEHIHTAECYRLICEMKEHIHSDECYSDIDDEQERFASDDDVAEIVGAEDYEIMPMANENNMIKIEARVIFGDYDDSDNHRYDEKNSDGYLYQTNFQLMHRIGSNFPLIDKSDLEGKIVEGNFVIKNSNDPARKDWCYQFNYVWEVPKLPSDTDTTGYYVQLNGVENNKITLGGKEFNVYYLRDDRLGHPGGNSDFGGANSGTDMYPTNAQHSYRNDSGVIYIFLDPVKDWNNSEGKNPNFVLRMKKRWDGHNSGGFKNRPKEKIIVQLQRWNGSQWVEFNKTYFPDLKYAYSCNLDIYNAEGTIHGLVHKNAVGGNTTLYYRHDEQGNGYYETAAKERIEVDGLDYDTLRNHDPKWVGDETIKDSLNRDDRVTVIFEDERDWNNIVLRYDGKNHPSHFTEGYYFNWGTVPYGQYRVVETASFYDVNDNDIYESDIDIDTSKEYYYMSFPPERDSDGVLHIQNFTKDMVLEVQKEWVDENGNKLTSGEFSRIIQFKVYRSTTLYSNPSENDLEPVWQENGSDIYETNEYGHLLMKTTDGYPELKMYDENGNKYYYYIQEVAVMENGEEMDEGDYTLMNGNGENFIYTKNGDKKIFGADFESGDARRFIINNTPTKGLDVEKKWKIGGETVEHENVIGAPKPEFEIYRCENAGTPEKSEDGYSVGDSKLERIAYGKIDGNGHMKVVSAEEGEEEGFVGDTQSMYQTPELKTSYATTDHIYELYVDNNGNVVYTENGTPNDNIWIKGNYAWFNISDQKIEGKYDEGKKALILNKNPNFWIKPKAGNVTLYMEFVNSDDVEILVDNQNNPPNDKHTYNVKNGVAVIQDLLNGGNYRFRTSSGTAYLKYARLSYEDPDDSQENFLPYYYYIREKGSNSYTLISGNGDGFVQGADGNYYVKLSSDTAKVTAENEPKYIQLEVEKKWYADKEMQTKLERTDKSFKFKVYKAYAQGEPKKDGNVYKVKDYILEEVKSYDSGADGKFTVSDLQAFEKDDDGKYHKLYYYIQEVNGNFKLLTDNVDGFVKDGAGNYGSYFNEDDGLVETDPDGKVKVTETMVEGTKIYNDKWENRPYMAFDGDKNTFFDGNGGDGWVKVDLGRVYEIFQISYCPRPKGNSDFPSRMQEGMFQFSVDGNNWETVFTIKEKPAENTMTHINSSNFSGDTTHARYVRFKTEKKSCNVAEIAIYVKQPKTFEFENQPTVRLEVKKKWLDCNENPDLVNPTEINFVLLSSTVKDITDISQNSDGSCVGTVNDNQITLTKVGEHNTEKLIWKSDDLLAYDNNENLLYYYILELDGDYNSAAYDVSYEHSVCWKKYEEIDCITVTNKAIMLEGIEMPETGGIGTCLFYIIGAVINGLTITALVLKKCKYDREY